MGACCGVGGSGAMEAMGGGVGLRDQDALALGTAHGVGGSLRSGTCREWWVKSACHFGDGERRVLKRVEVISCAAREMPLPIAEQESRASSLQRTRQGAMNRGHRCSGMRRWLLQRPCAVSGTWLRRRWLSIAPLTRTTQRTSDGIALSRTSSGDGRTSEARSLLRSLLRESTYLPDGHVRQWVQQHVCASFRGYNRRTLEKTLSASDIRLAKKLKDGRMALALLQRAAQGDQWCLRRVMMMAYGRVGKRRRELLKPLLSLSANESSVADSQAGHTILLDRDPTYLVAKNETARNKRKTEAASLDRPPMVRFEPRTLSPQLWTLLRSQIQYGPPPLTRGSLRRIQPLIPELNTWLRPMPQKRLKNIEKKHYAYLLDRTLPPLPQDEWERLRSLACGRVVPELPKPRRCGLAPVDGPSDVETDALNLVVRYGKIPQKFSKQIPTGAMNQRTMQRMYAKVFSQCPKLQYDAEKQEWKAIWGEQAMLEAAAANIEHG